MSNLDVNLSTKSNPTIPPPHAPLQWRHNERDGVSHHRRHVCLLNRLLRRKSKKTSKLRVTGLCEGNSPVTGEFPAHRPVTWKMFPFDDVTMLWQFITAVVVVIVIAVVIILSSSSSSSSLLSLKTIDWYYDGLTVAICGCREGGSVSFIKRTRSCWSYKGIPMHNLITEPRMVVVCT